MRPVPTSLIAAAMPAGCGAGDSPAVPVTLALDFQPNAAHAGIYAAEGPGLRVRAPSPSTVSLKLLTAGRADIAVADIHDLGRLRILERPPDVREAFRP